MAEFHVVQEAFLLPRLYCFCGRKLASFREIDQILRR
jgi:hypothetical protein